VTGTNYDPNEMVALSGCNITPVSVLASGTGSFSTTVTIPPGSAGTCVLTGTGVTSGRSATTSITLTAAVTPVNLVPAAAPLAFTGADISILLAVAAIAIAFGGIFVLGSRRKLRAEQ
jgi:hypothetical protein